MTVGEGRKGVSKSTLRSDVRTYTDQIAAMTKAGNVYKAPGTRSVRRSRPTISQISQSTTIQKNATIRRNQSSAIIRKVQLKKTIQQPANQENQSDPQKSLPASQVNLDRNHSQDPASGALMGNTNGVANKVDESALVITRSPKGAPD